MSAIILLPLIIWGSIRFNERPHASGKTFCQRHLVDDYPLDENGREIMPKDDNKDGEQQ